MTGSTNRFPGLISNRIMLSLGSIIIILAVMIILIFENSRWIDEYSYLINESGKIRGGIQRTVKTALAVEDTDGLIESINASIRVLESSKIKGTTRHNLNLLKEEWTILCALMTDLENSESKRLELYKHSEKIWVWANELVFEVEKQAHDSTRLFFWIILGMTFLIVVLAIVLVVTKFVIHDKIEYRADHDNLTGLYNRHYFNAIFSREAMISKRLGRSFAIMMCDIDLFKNINDKYGHDIGDIVLKKVADVFKSTCREMDVAARIGGEEFVILAILDSQEEILVYANRIRECVEKQACVNEICTSISIGVAIFKIDSTMDEVMRRADGALYKAKRLGRNRVEISE